MKSSTKSRQDEYTSRLNALYSEVQKWIENTGLGVLQKTIKLNEEIPGRYEVPTLTISDAQGKKVADLLPVGAWIIGAEGRVDLVGTVDREALVYMAEGGPQITTKEEEGGRTEQTRSIPLFRGVEEAGWYWIERWRPSRARRLTGQLFVDLLSEVSDYDIR